MKRLSIVTLAVLMSASLLFGCNTSASSQAPSSPDASGSGVPANGNASKTSLVVAINADVATLHPSDYSTGVEYDVSNQIYDSLMHVTLDNSQPPSPRVAKSYKVSDDGLTYTFALRDDITFHNGTKLTAKDVKFSAELYMNSKFQKARVTGLKSVNIIDDYTVEFILDAVYAPFINSAVDIHIASKDYFDSVGVEEFANKPIGTGPYSFVSHDLGSKITLKAYDSYYGGAPTIKDVTFKVLADDTTLAVSIQTGEVDFAQVSEINYDTLKDKSGIVIENVPQSKFGFVAMNLEKAPYNDVRFRKAVSYAIDRQNMIDLTLNGIGTPNSSILSPLRFGWSNDLPKYEYNVEKAKSLLTEMSITTPYDLGVMYVAERYSSQAQVLQNDLANIGLNTTIEILEFNAYLSKLMSGDYGISTLSMSLDGDTQQFELAYGAQYIGGANNARHNNPEIEAMFAKAVKTTDEKEREKLYNDIFRKVDEEAIYAGLFNTEILFAHNDKLKCHPFVLEGRYYINQFNWQ